MGGFGAFFIDDRVMHFVPYSEKYRRRLIETLYLLSSQQNAAHLAQSIHEYRTSQAVRREFFLKNDVTAEDESASIYDKNLEN